MASNILTAHEEKRKPKGISAKIVTASRTMNTHEQIQKLTKEHAYGEFFRE